MRPKSPQENTVPCPGCGGHGRFEWTPNPKVPKAWAPTALCAMCQGTGRVPAAWVSGRTK